MGSMMYRAVYATSSGTNINMWRPRIAASDDKTALLLGRTPANWYAENATKQARELVEQGYWVVTVDTPNWGNQTDMTSIDTALTWLNTTWGRPIDRVAVVAHNAGCVAALNWGMRHHNRVASMSLQSPIIDLAERYKRVSADRSSIAAAFGGSIGLSLSGAGSSFAYTPDHATLDITGTSDLDVRAEVAATDWTPSANQSLISKYITTGNQRSYRLRLNAAGTLELIWSANGSATLSATSTAAPSVSNGATLAVRATLDVDNGASGNTVTFYTATSIDGSWTQLGSAVTQAGVTSIFSSTAQLEAGSVANGSELFQGTIYAVEVRSGIGGTVVSGMDFTTHVDSTDKKWTLNGSATESMRTWNPAHTHRKYIVADLLGDRLKLWWSGADTQTPPSVTAALATAYGADTGTLSDPDPTLSDPEPPVDDAAAADTAWLNQDAHDEMKKWHTYVQTSADFAGYKGGDAFSTTILPDGRWASTFADSFLSQLSAAVPSGSDTDDGTYKTGLPTRNMLVLHDSSGAITGQIYSGAPGNNPPMIPNQTTYPSHWYWPIDKVVDNGALQVGCWLVNNSSGNFGHIVDSHIVTLNATSLAQTAETPLSVGETFSTYGFFVDGGFIYVLGQEYVGGYDSYSISTVTQTRIARVPVGQLTTPASWEFRTGSGWSSSSAAAVPIVDNAAANVTGDSCLTKSGSTYVLAAMATTEGAARLYSSSNPWGPWTQYDTVAIPQLGTTRYGSTTVGYHLKWHPHLNSGGRLMLSWNGNFFGSGGTPFDDIDYIHFSPHLLLVPAP